MAPLAQAFQVRIDLDPDTNGFRAELIDSVEEGSTEAAQRGGTAFREKFSTIAKAAGIAVGATLVLGLTEALRQQDASRTLAAQLGAAPADAQRLGELAGSLYADGFGANMEEVNAALRAVVQNGIVGLDQTNAAIEAAAANVTNLAALLGEDASRVSAAVSQMLRTGLARSAEEAFDILTAATQNGINKAEDLLDTINEYGTQFRKVGLDGQTAMGLISQAIQAGARDSDIAADAIKEFSIRAVDGSKAARDSFTALGFNADEMIAKFARGGPEAAAAFDQVLDALRQTQGRADAATIAFGLFGTQSEDLGKALYAMDVTGAAAGLGDIEGAAKRAGDTMASSATAQVTTFGRMLKQELIEAIAAAIPTLQSMGEWVNRNREWIVPLAATIGVLTASVWAVNAAMTAWAVIQRAGAVVAYAHTAALAVQNAVRTASLSLIATWIGVHAIDLGQWVAKTAAVVAHNVALAAHATWIGIVRAATLTWTVVQAALNVTFLGFPLVWIVLAIGAFVAAIVLAWKHSETFRDVVKAVWNGIKVAVEAVVNWFTGTLWPILRGVIDLIVGYWRFMANMIIGAVRLWWEGVQLYWSFIRDKVFAPLRTLITETIPNAFRSGVEAIGNIWSRVKELALTPVNFVIGVVINRGIIDTFNKVSGFFHGPTFGHVPTIGDGYGQARGPGMGDGYGRGSMMGDGLGFGDVMKLVAGPAGWLADKVGIGRIVQHLGDNPFAQLLTGVGRTLLSALVDRVKAMISAGLEFLGGGDSGVGLAAGIAAVLAHLRQVFGNVPLISGRRPGDRTLSGSISYHSSGRAIDIAPVLAWAQFLNQFYGPQLRELITPWQYLNIHNGRQHNYSAAVWAQHNFAGGNAHIHAALANGGVLSEPILGVGRSGRRYTMAERGPEHVVPQATMGDVLDALERLIEAVERIAPGVGAHLSGAASATLRTARAF